MVNCNCQPGDNLCRKITLPAQLDNLGELMRFTLDIAIECGLTKKRLDELEIVLEEALVNVINYAYKDEKGDIEITCHNKDGRFIINVIDAGQPFDINSLKDPDINADIPERRVGGLGVYMIKKL